MMMRLKGKKQNKAKKDQEITIVCLSWAVYVFGWDEGSSWDLVNLVFYPKAASLKPSDSLESALSDSEPPAQTVVHVTESTRYKFCLNTLLFQFT